MSTFKRQKNLLTSIFKKYLKFLEMMLAECPTFNKIQFAYFNNKVISLYIFKTKT